MKRLFALSLWAVAAFAAVLTSSPRTSFAGAQRPTLAASQRDRARKLFSQGELHFEARRYDAALAAYNKAFTLSNLRGFLLNIGHCYARLGNIQQATKNYRFYLQRSPREDKHRKDVEQAIATLTRTVDATTVSSVEQPASVTSEESPTTTRAEVPLPQLALDESSSESMMLASSPSASHVAHGESQRWLWPSVAAVVLAAGATWFLIGRDGTQDVKEGSIGTLSR